MFLLIRNTFWIERNYEYNGEIYIQIVMNRLTEIGRKKNKIGFPGYFCFHPEIKKKSGVGGRAPTYIQHGDFFCIRCVACGPQQFSQVFRCPAKLPGGQTTQRHEKTASVCDRWYFVFFWQIQPI